MIKFDYDTLSRYHITYNSGHLKLPTNMATNVAGVIPPEYHIVLLNDLGFFSFSNYLSM